MVEPARRFGALQSTRSMNRCAHCNAPATIRDSEQITPTIRDYYFHCTNSDCGHVWKAQMSPVYTLCPSQVPNPEVHIPPPPPGYIRRRYPARGEEPDPNQLLMFQEETERIAAPSPA